MVMLLLQFVAQLLLDGVHHTVENADHVLLFGAGLFPADHLLDYVIHERNVVDERMAAKVQRVVIPDKTHPVVSLMCRAGLRPGPAL